MIAVSRHRAAATAPRFVDMRRHPPVNILA